MVTFSHLKGEFYVNLFSWEPCRIQNHGESYKIIVDHTRPQMSVKDKIGSYKTRQSYARPYRAKAIQYPTLEDIMSLY